MRRILLHISVVALVLCAARIVHADPSPATTEPAGKAVEFKGSHGAALAGTLLVPEGKGLFPAVLLLAGSGPTDRDGNQPPNLTTDLLKQIAEALAGKGIASLRYDKRGMYANAAELPKNPSQFGDFFSWENFVGDAAAGWLFLKQQPMIDPNHVGILGHSEGGLLALEAAHTLKPNGQAPAALILLSTPGRTVDAVITDQLKRLLALQGATPEQTEYFLSENVRITRAIRQTGQVPGDLPTGLAALYPPYLGKFLHSELAVDPCNMAEDFTGPVLILDGSADVQVSPDRDAKALDTALSHRKDDDHALAIIPGASHNLKIPTSATDPGFAGPVAPAAMDELQQWVTTHLARR